MIIIAPKTFKMSTVYSELGKVILLISQKHSWDEKSYFLEKLKEKFGSIFSQK